MNKSKHTHAQYSNSRSIINAVQDARTPEDEHKIIESALSTLSPACAAALVNPWSLWYNVDRLTGEIYSYELAQCEY
jgi:hypothetical protein